jgi:predicted Rossmann fold nucleotide-binding protein DprA/Smf involved in DNA uptake
MKRIKTQLKTISKSLASLSKQVDKITKEVDKFQPAKKTAPAKKAAPAKRKKTVRKAAVRKKAAPAKGQTVLDQVHGVIKRSPKGTTIAALKTKTGLDSRQLSNALYKLSKKGLVHAKSRGLYVKQ